MIHWQKNISNDLISCRALTWEDFEPLYSVAADPKIWEQHPNKNRFEREIFTTFFEGAMASKGAYLIIDNATERIVGSSRFYDHDKAQKSVLIGYTFLSVACWGKGYNPTLKRLMLNHAFEEVETVYFHVGEANVRSRIAMERTGARLVRTIEVAYHGEAVKTNVEYCIQKSEYV